MRFLLHSSSLVEDKDQRPWWTLTCCCCTGQVQYRAKDQDEAEKQARRAGWLTRNHVLTCPDCKGNNKGW